MQNKSFAVIGHPIGHTMSPFIHTRLLALAGVAGSYGVRDIPPEKLAAARGKLAGLDGFNVTIPHKQAIRALLDAVEGDAAAFGSVNTVAVENGRMTGYTTDGVGFTKALAAAGVPLAGRVLLLGSGGVAHVFANEILRAPGTELTLMIRRHAEERYDEPGIGQAESEARIARLHARQQCFVETLHRGDRTVEVCDEAELEARCRNGARFDLLVNGTSAGMYPNVAGCPVSQAVVAQCAAVFDAVYNPGVTMLLKYARALGRPAVGGMGMLVWQAAASEEIWLHTQFDPASVAPIVEAAEMNMRLRFGNVVLCGFMGCGKSTTGALLAKNLGRTFVDMDRYIEQQEGCTVQQIFAQKGEAYFRACERRACEALSRRTGLVIAAGGGTLIDPQNAALLRETGVVVLLDTPYALLEERLARDHTRPLLERPDREEAMHRLYEMRMPLYRQAADLTICAGNGDAPALELAQKLEGAAK